MAAAAPRLRTPLTVQGLLARGTVWLLLGLLVALPYRSIDFSLTCSKAVIFAAVGLSLNILIGYTGQLSLGHQGFIGLGGLVAANVATRAHWPFAAALGAGMVAGVAVAILMGLVALRITGLYLSLITLVFGLTMGSSLFQVNSLTNGGAGINALRPSALQSEPAFYLFTLGLLALVIYLDRQLTRSKVGRALLALKENERAAEAFGIDVTRYKLLAFALSGGLAGLAGAVYVYQLQQFSGQNFEGIAGVNLALLFVVMVVVGGPGNRVGVVLASLFFGLIDTLLKFIFTHGSGVLHHIPLLKSYYQADSKAAVAGVIGALLLLQTLIFNPGGLGQVVSPITRWLGGKPLTLHDEEGSGPAAVEGSSVRA